MVIMNTIYRFLKELGRIRAATYFARAGDTKAARKIMLAE